MTQPDTHRNPDQDLDDLNAALEAAGIFIAVDVRDGALILSGEVDSPEMQQAALDLSDVIAERHGLEVEDAIEVLEIDIEIGADPERAGSIGASDMLPGDAGVVREIGTTDAGLASDEGITYFPPTDPVIGDSGVNPGERENDPEVIGGFQPTSMDDDEIDLEEERPFGDEEISDNVRRELREDASTTDLDIRAETLQRVVYLRGEVSALEDSDNAEAVAARVPGVIEVRNQIDVIGPLADRL